jgi:hypothetical protein
MTVDPLHLAIALSPLAVYLLLLGLVNLSARPLITTGARDVAALAIAISGCVAVGPMELFLPEHAAQQMGAYVWLLLLAIYALGVFLLVLMLRPRLVIHNMTVETFRPVLAEVVSRLDGDARWVGDSLILPRLGVQLHLEPFHAMRNIQLVSSGPRQSDAGWKQLESALASSLRELSSPRSPYGLRLVILALLMVALMTFSVVQDTPLVAQSLREMLRQ